MVGGQAGYHGQIVLSHVAFRQYRELVIVATRLLHTVERNAMIYLCSLRNVLQINIALVRIHSYFTRFVLL